MDHWPPRCIQNLQTCTDTDRYLQYHSHHPMHVKRGVVRCLFERAQNITQRQKVHKEHEHQKEVLKCNGYPATFIRSSIRPPRRIKSEAGATTEL